MNATESAPWQLFEALPPHIEDALRASIQRFGVLVPITVDQQGQVLDGHHRKRIAEQLKVPYDRLVRYCQDDDERQEIARTLNSDRRQLTEDQRREVAAALRQDGHSIRAIAAALGAGKSTIAEDLAQLSGAGQLEQPDRVKGLDGKSRPSRRPQAIARTEREAERAQAVFSAIAAAEESGALDLSASNELKDSDRRTVRRAMHQRATLSARDIRDIEAAATRISRAKSTDEWLARQLEVLDHITACHPDLARFLPGIEREEIKFEIYTSRWREGWISWGNEPDAEAGPGEIWLRVPDRTRRYDWQDFDWPRYTGIRDTCLDEAEVPSVQPFSPAEWDDLASFTESEAYRGLEFDGARWFAWGRISGRDGELSRYACPAARRDYDPDYGAFIAQHGSKTDCEPMHDGVPLFVRRGWGDWHAVEFNDGRGGRERRRYFAHDFVLHMFVKQALATVDPLAFTHENLRDLQCDVFKAMPSELSWFYARHRTIDRDRAITALESMLARLHKAEQLNGEEIGRLATAWLQDYTPAEWWDTGTWRQGKCTGPRRPDGTRDDDQLERLCREGNSV